MSRQFQRKIEEPRVIIASLLLQGMKKQDAKPGRPLDTARQQPPVGMAPYKNESNWLKKLLCYFGLHQWCLPRLTYIRQSRISWVLPLVWKG
jgi:hypothetical protein